jgi:GNAT superfamily N-acetyltransferase
MKLSIEFVPKEKQRSEYDWADISDQSERIGKARCKIEHTTIIIYSINIYPEWEGHGYGREFVDYCKKRFQVVIANRVRPTAIGFWESMGFLDSNNGDWIYQKQSSNLL